MTAYYNEIEPFAAAWLRELIQANIIAPGEVDERSIVDVRAGDLAGFTQCHFFAGIGVWSYALKQAGWPDDRPVHTGSCPCQPFSDAGAQGAFSDTRHLWPRWHSLIRELRPHVLFGEQVASKLGLAWLDAVHADLEGEGYTVGAADLCAAGVGAPHIRQRLYWVADDHKRGWSVVGTPRLHDHREPGHDAARRGEARSFWSDAEWLACRDGKARPVEPGTFPLVDGAPARVGRLRGYGNAICAPQAIAFIEAYLETREGRALPTTGERAG